MRKQLEAAAAIRLNCFLRLLLSPSSEAFLTAIMKESLRRRCRGRENRLTNEDESQKPLVPYNNLSRVIEQSLLRAAHQLDGKSPVALWPDDDN